jgi:Protein of unknown function (DUF3551)
MTEKSQSVPVISAVAFFLLASTSQPDCAHAGPIVPKGHYCLAYDTGGSDCSFTSYPQCLAAASGIDAECYGKIARDDEDDSSKPLRNSHAGGRR